MTTKRKETELSRAINDLVASAIGTMAWAWIAQHTAQALFGIDRKWTVFAGVGYALSSLFLYLYQILRAVRES